MEKAALIRELNLNKKDPFIFVGRIEWEDARAMSLLIVSCQLFDISQHDDPVLIGTLPIDCFAFFENETYGSQQINRADQFNQDQDAPRHLKPPEIWVEREALKNHLHLLKDNTNIIIRLKIEEKGADDELIPRTIMPFMDLLPSRGPFGFQYELQYQAFKPDQGTVGGLANQLKSHMKALGFLPFGAIFIKQSDVRNLISLMGNGQFALKISAANRGDEAKRDRITELLPFLCLSVGGMKQQAIVTVSKKMDLEANHLRAQTSANFYDLYPFMALGNEGQSLNELSGLIIGLNETAPRQIWERFFEIAHGRKGPALQLSFFEQSESQDKREAFEQMDISLPFELTNKQLKAFQENPSIYLPGKDNRFAQNTLGIYLGHSSTAMALAGTMATGLGSVHPLPIGAIANPARAYQTSSSLQSEGGPEPFAFAGPDFLLPGHISLSSVSKQKGAKTVKSDHLSYAKKDKMLFPDRRFLFNDDQDDHSSPTIETNFYHYEVNIGLEQLEKGAQQPGALLPSFTDIFKDVRDEIQLNDFHLLYRNKRHALVDGANIPPILSSTIHLDQLGEDLLVHLATFYGSEGWQLCHGWQNQSDGALKQDNVAQTQITTGSKTAIDRLALIYDFDPFTHRQRRLYRAGRQALGQLTYGAMADFAVLFGSVSFDKASKDEGRRHSGGCYIIPAALAGASYYLSHDLFQQDQSNLPFHLHVHVGFEKTKAIFLQKNDDAFPVGKILKQLTLPLGNMHLDQMIWEVIAGSIQEAMKSGQAIAWQEGWQNKQPGQSSLGEACGQNNKGYFETILPDFKSRLNHFLLNNQSSQQNSDHIARSPILDLWVKADELPGAYPIQPAHPASGQENLKWDDAQGFCQIKGLYDQNNQLIRIQFQLDLAKLSNSILKPQPQSHDPAPSLTALNILLGGWAFLLSASARDLYRIAKGEGFSWSYSFEQSRSNGPYANDRLFLPLQRLFMQIFNGENCLNEQQVITNKTKDVGLDLGRLSHQARLTMGGTKLLQEKGDQFLSETLLESGRELILIAFQNGAVSDDKSSSLPQLVAAGPLKYTIIGKGKKRGEIVEKASRILLVSTAPGFGDFWIKGLFSGHINDCIKLHQKLQTNKAEQSSFIQSLIKANNKDEINHLLAMDENDGQGAWMRDLSPLSNGAHNLFDGFWTTHLDLFLDNIQFDEAAARQWNFRWFDFDSGLLNIGKKSYLIDGLSA